MSAAAAGDTISVKAGTCRGQVVIPATKSGITVTGTTGFSWKTCRFNEAGNTGTGATQGTTDRPQMSTATAANYTAQSYLAGSDGWNPVQ